MQSGYNKQLITLTIITLSGVLEKVPNTKYLSVKNVFTLLPIPIAYCRTILSLLKNLKYCFRLHTIHFLTQTLLLSEKSGLQSEMSN